jgi:protein phosphatase
MGSTCLCAWLIDNRLYSASVGNSRLFLLRDRKLHQLNLIHQLPRDLPGPDTNKKARRKTKEDPLQGYLGSKSPVEIDLRLVLDSSGQSRPTSKKQGLRLQPNDRILLCTDGLGDALKPNEILEVIGNSPIETAAQDLAQYSLEKGARANLTAIVIGIPPALPPLRAEPVNWLRVLASVLLLGALVFLGVFAWWLWISQIPSLNPAVNPPINTLTPVPTSTTVPN